MSLVKVGTSAAAAAWGTINARPIATAPIVCPIVTLIMSRPLIWRTGRSALHSLPEHHKFYWIVTLTWALVQQHWNPPPPSPDSSFACTLTMYSPAALNVAVVLTISPCLVADKRALANVTVPGPRNLCSDTDATVLDGLPPSPCAGFGSSTQMLKVTG